MDVPEAVLEKLKCLECATYLSQGPVYQHQDGAASCGGCFSPQRPATRNPQYEAIARLVPFPQAAGRQSTCPVLGPARCAWLGPRGQVLQHCRAQHPTHVLDNPCSLEHDITTSNQHSYVLHAFQLLFLLHAEVCVATSKLYHSVELLDDADLARKFVYKLQISRKEVELTMNGEVSSPALSLDITSLVSILGGRHASFTITISRRGRSLWRCERCAPCARPCRNQSQGCAYQDMPPKCGKHEAFFCRARTQCLACDARVERGTLAAHYASAHRDAPAWRATPTGGCWRLLATPAGTAVCWYMLHGAQLVVSVSVDVESERLAEFRCVVHVTEPTTGVTCTYTPDVTYEDRWDWRVEINQQEFPATSDAFDICVNIS